MVKSRPFIFVRPFAVRRNGAAACVFYKCSPRKSWDYDRIFWDYDRKNGDYTCFFGGSPGLTRTSVRCWHAHDVGKYAGGRDVGAGAVAWMSMGYSR